MDYHQMSLSERQRYILEKGLKRKVQRGEASRRYENDSASGEDPLASASVPPASRQNQRVPRPVTPGTKIPMQIPSQAKLPLQISPQKKVAVLLAPTTKKDRDEFMVVRTEDDEPSARRRVATETHSQSQPSPATEAPASERGKMNRRGRPKGWKRGMAYTDLRPRPAISYKPISTATGGLKRRGRPPKPVSPPPRLLYHQEEAGFFSFLCEWQGCEAELHNLATLRRHVHVVHGQEGSHKGCQWGMNGCCAGTGDTAGREFRRHIEDAHLIPMAWHVGDGPRHQGDGVHVTSSAAASDEQQPDDEKVRKIPRWLKDEDGNQVTEGIWEQEVEDLATWKQNRRKLRELLIRRDENLPSGEEESDQEEENEDRGS